MKFGTDSTILGMHGFTRMSALRSLALIRIPEAFDYLISRLTPGLEYERCRPVLVGTIAASAAWQDPVRKKRAVDVLGDAVVGDHSVGVRKACVNALVALEAKEKISRVEESAKTF